MSEQLETQPSRILVADDVTLMREFLVAVLIDEGYLAIGEGDGEKVHLRATQIHPQLILLDYSITQAPLTRLLNELKHDATTAQIPVVLLLDKHASPAIANHSHVRGAITKPFYCIDLMDEVHRHLASSS